MSDATLFQIKPIVGVSQKRPTISLLNKSDSGVLTFRSRWCYCARIITASARVLVFVLFVFRLPAVLVPARARLRQVGHRAAAAAAAGAAVAEAVDHEHPALFLPLRALLQEDRLHAAEDHRADEVPVVPDAQEPSVHLHPCALPGPEYRTSEVQVPCPAVPAGYCRHRPPDLDFRLACAQVVGHAPAAKDGNQAPPSRRVCLAIRGVQLAQVNLSRGRQALHPLRVCLAVRGVQMAQVRHLSPEQQALHPIRACLSAGRDQMAWANRRARAPEVSLQFFHAHRALVFLAQMAEEKCVR